MGRKNKSRDLEDGLEARGLSEGTSSTVCKDEGHRERRSHSQIMRSPKAPLSSSSYTFMRGRCKCPFLPQMNLAY